MGRADGERLADAETDADGLADVPADGWPAASGPGTRGVPAAATGTRVGCPEEVRSVATAMTAPAATSALIATATSREVGTLGRRRTVRYRITAR